MRWWWTCAGRAAGAGPGLQAVLGRRVGASSAALGNEKGHCMAGRAEGSPGKGPARSQLSWSVRPPSPVVTRETGMGEAHD